MNEFQISDDQVRRFQEDGYFLAENLFDAEEMKLLGTLARAEHQQGQQAASRRDGHGGAIRLTVENELGDDIYGAFVRCRRIVDTMERLLGRGSLPLPPQDDLEGAVDRRRLGMASGLWLLVQQRLPVSASGKLHDRRGPGHQGERLPASAQGLAPPGPDRSRQGRRPDRGRHGASQRRPGAIGAGALRAGARLGDLLPLQPAALLGPEPERQAALGADLLLQRRPQRSLQGIAASALFAAWRNGRIRRIKEIGRRIWRCRNPQLLQSCGDTSLRHAMSALPKERHDRSHRPSGQGFRQQLLYAGLAGCAGLENSGGGVAECRACPSVSPRSGTLPKQRPMSSA